MTQQIRASQLTPGTEYGHGRTQHLNRRVVRMERCGRKVWLRYQHRCEDGWLPQVLHELLDCLRMVTVAGNWPQ